LLVVVVFGTEAVVFGFFEEAEVRAGLRLGALFVSDSFDGVAEGGHGWDAVLCWERRGVSVLQLLMGGEVRCELMAVA
jgi:hypothetical protein